MCAFLLPQPTPALNFRIYILVSHNKLWFVCFHLHVERLEISLTQHASPWRKGETGIGIIHLDPATLNSVGVTVGNRIPDKHMGFFVLFCVKYFFSSLRRRCWSCERSSGVPGHTQSPPCSVENVTVVGTWSPGLCGFLPTWGYCNNLKFLGQRCRIQIWKLSCVSSLRR